MKLICTLILGVILMATFPACSDSDDGIDLGGDLVLNVSTLSLPASEFEKVTFEVTAGGKDVTAYCKVWNMSKAEVLPGKSFSTIEPGEYRFVAKYESLASNEVKVNFTPVAYFYKKLLLQQITSTTCSNCPLLANNIEYLLENTFDKKDFSWLAYHGPMLGVDPMQIQEYTQPLMYKWGEFYPNLIMDNIEAFGEDMKTPEASTKLFKKYLALPGKVGIAINSSINGKTISVTVKIKSLMEFPGGCKLAVALSENSLTYPQLMPGGKETDHDYVHDHVVRKYLTGIFGNMLEEEVMGYQKEYEETFTYTMTEKDVWNTKLMDVTVYVIEGEKGQVINTQSVKLGESVDFKYAKSEE